MRFITGAVCCICGAPLEKEEEEYCENCRRKKHVFSSCRAPFVYQGAMKESLMRFKYRGRAEYAVFYGKAMAEYAKEQRLLRDIDLLVPVPVHRQRLAERGYNQAELLAREISSLTGIPCDAKTVIRKKKTEAQKRVSGTVRSRNLAGAFAVTSSGKSRLFGKRILLIDDIFTTGSTADAVSRCLLEAGGFSVSVLCLTITPGYSDTGMNNS